MSHVDDGALHAYLDGELTAVEVARLEQHLAECPTCRARLEEERALVERASALLALAAPPERDAPPLQQLDRSRPLWRARVPIAWAATVVLALGVGWFAGSGKREAGSVVPATDAVPMAPSVARVDEARDQAAPPPTTPPPAADQVADRRRDDVVASRAVQQPEREQAKAAAPLAEGARAEAGRAAAADADAREARAAANVVAPAAGQPVPAVDGELQVRGARAETPPPPPAPALAAPAERREARLVPRDLVTTTWTVVLRGPARTLLGTDPVGVRGLPVKQIRQSPGGDGVVVVEQALDSSAVIQVFQQRATAGQEITLEGAPAAQLRQRDAGGANERLARYVGNLRVEIAGPVGTDSLNKLLERVEAIPE